jgi:tetratricopeptide (TPR) repeat protein
MAFNKSKALENALKFLNQGKVPQAIGEYQQILRQDPKDQATLMTVGDLYARQGDMTPAIEYFERLAQVYLNDGFNSKAIAIYKKIAKLAPNELEPLERLADLYVQQGVLSEARPLFLQIAEAHLKANQAPKAVDVLHRLLDVEPENLRVQMRLAELYNVMGQKKEAAQTYLTYAQRLFDHNELDEAQKLIDRALEVDAGNGAALLLKAKVLGAAAKGAQAIAILASHPEANAGGEVTNLLVDLELKSGQAKSAAERGRKDLARGHAHFAMLYRVTEALIESGQADEALPLLDELRDPMIEASEQDKFLHSLSRATERLPGRIEPLEMVVDFCRHTSDSFRLTDALGKLSEAYAATGDYPRAEQLVQEMIDRNKNDERLVERLNQLRERSGGSGAAPSQAAPPAVPDVSVPEPTEQPTVQLKAQAEGNIPASAPILEEVLDEETQRYIAQALTDVDLFSSYGLTQKATHLLESVLERSPRHTPTLERLLDLHLGAGNERRTAELASLLEQIHRERNDTVNADRFLELRQRFQKAAGIAEHDLPQAPPAVPSAPVAIPERQLTIDTAVVEDVPASTPEPQEVMPAHVPAPAASAPAEFEVPLAELEPESEPEPVQEQAVASAPLVEEVAPTDKPQPVVTSEEVDLSDEWEAISQEVVEPAAETPAPAELKIPEVIEEPEPEPVTEVLELEATPFDEPLVPMEQVETVSLDEPVAPMAEAESASIDEPVEASEPEPEIVEAAEPANETIEIVDEPVAEAPTAETVAEGTDFELELTPDVPAGRRAGAATTEDFIDELVSEIDDMEAPQADPLLTGSGEDVREHVAEPVAAAPATPMASGNGSHGTAASVPAPNAETLNELAEVFQEFRAELGELSDEDEDLETHYNLGIAYREMGLLDEAIGEFQRVAKAIQKGKPFRYAMNCSTMLALSFMDKGEPKIAALWYQRALEVPGLDHEAVLALRYDLGVSLEMAGESKSALDSFRQVYAMNIDYRDVADRISTLQKV